MKTKRMSMYLRLLTALFLIGFTGANAQNINIYNVQEWPTGSVVLKTGEVVSGAIAYHRLEEAVRVTSEDGTVKTFTPINVDHFVGKEIPGGRPYLFKTFNWGPGKDRTNFKKPTFFEMLHDGKYALIAHSTYSRHNSGSPQIDRAGTLTNQTVDGWREEYSFSYFVMLPDGEIVQLNKLRKDLFNIFGKKSSKVKAFIKANKLSLDRPHEVAAIMSYFNTLP